MALTTIGTVATKLVSFLAGHQQAGSAASLVETPDNSLVIAQSNASGQALVDVPPGTWTPAAAAALADSGVISAASCVARTVLATNAHSAARWLMLFDSATVPADATAPRVPAVYVPAETTIILHLGGLTCTAGLSWAMSSTQATKTITSDTLHVVSAEIV